MPEFSRAPDRSPYDDIKLSPELAESLLAAASTEEERTETMQVLEELLPWLAPSNFGQLVDSTHLQPPHIRLLNEKIADLVSGRLGKRKLMVTMPPRHGKSEVCSKFLPAWYLARYPDRRVILTSYEADFAADWGRKARDVLEQASEWAGVKIRSDSKAANRWNLVGHKGGMQTAGARGPITGKGAHLLIIDDPVKNAEDALSETLRQKTWDWYISTAKTRLEPGACQLVIMTRWHEDDLAGRLLATEGDEWEVVNFPAIAEEEDILGRVPGDALWPGAYDIQALAEIRDTPETGYWWSALYQQHPTTDEGGVFSRSNFRHWTYAGDEGKAYNLDGLVVPVKDTIRFQTIDLAASKRTKADFTVVATWAITRTEPAHLILLGRFRDRVEAPDHLSTVEAEFAKWKRPGEPKCRFAAVGKQTYGLALIQEAKRHGAFWIRGEDEDTDKFSRSIPAAGMVSAHVVWFPRDAEWLEVWESELLAFNNGTHDDQVDALSLAAIIYGQRRSWAPRLGAKEPETFEDKIWARHRKAQAKRKLHPMLGKW